MKCAAYNAIACTKSKCPMTLFTDPQESFQAFPTMHNFLCLSLSDSTWHIFMEQDCKMLANTKRARDATCLHTLCSVAGLLQEPAKRLPPCIRLGLEAMPVQCLPSLHTWLDKTHKLARSRSGQRRPCTMLASLHAAASHTYISSCIQGQTRRRLNIRAATRRLGQQLGTISGRYKCARLGLGLGLFKPRPNSVRLVQGSPPSSPGSHRGIGPSGSCWAGTRS